MERYSKYKDSGVEWIGEIPEGWSVHSLRRDFHVIAGATPKSGVSKYWNGDIPWITPADMNANSKTISSGNRFITQEGLDSCGTALAPAGSVVVSNRAPIGQVALTTRTLCTNQGCKCLVPNSAVSTTYIYYYLSCVTAPLNAAGQGTTFLELSKTALADFPCPIPDIQEQQYIADYLDEKTAAIDAAMADVERSIELLNEYRQSVISEAVTKGLDPNAPMKDSGINWIGDIPLQWTVTKIINLAIRKSGHTPDKKKEEYWQNGDIVWISLADSPALRKQHYVSESNTMTNMEGINHSSAELLPPGTVLLSRDASIGLTAIAATELAVSQHFMAYICGPKLYNEYLYYTFESMQQELNRLSMGSTIPTIGLPLIHGLRIPVPPIEEQHEIVDCLQHKLNELDSLIAQKQSLLVRLKEYRSSLISECVTGKVKVPGVKED